MKHLILLTAFSFMSFVIPVIGQVNCTPDETYADSTGGVYPRPVSEAFPDAGIDLIACPGEDYFFTFTTNIPHTIVFGGVSLPIASLRLRGDTPVMGLPDGLTYVCEPPNCEMAAGTLGCIALTGTVDSEVEAGIYPLVILVDIVTGFGTTIPTQFPNDAIAQGEYFIEVGQVDGTGECISVNIKDKPIASDLKVFPNPAINQVHFELPNHLTGLLRISILDVLGRKVFNQNIEADIKPLTIDITNIPQGNYRLIIQQNANILQTPLVITR